MSDGRPVPPPKPSHYQLSRPPWSNENEMIENGMSQMHQSLPNSGFGYSSVYPQSKRPNNSNLANTEIPNGPPAYYPSIPHKDQPPNIRAPALPTGELPNNTYAEQQSTFGSPLRK